MIIAAHLLRAERRHLVEAAAGGGGQRVREHAGDELAMIWPSFTNVGPSWMNPSTAPSHAARTTVRPRRRTTQPAERLHDVEREHDVDHDQAPQLGEAELLERRRDDLERLGRRAVRVRAAEAGDGAGGAEVRRGPAPGGGLPVLVLGDHADEAAAVDDRYVTEAVGDHQRRQLDRRRRQVRG